MSTTSTIATFLVRGERERGAGGVYFFKEVQMFMYMCTCMYTDVCERESERYLSLQLLPRLLSGVCERGGGGGSFGGFYFV